MNWGIVAAAVRVDEERFNVKFGASGGNSSSSQRYMPRQKIEEEVEYDDEGYGSESDASEDEDVEDDIF